MTPDRMQQYPASAPNMLARMGRMAAGYWRRSSLGVLATAMLVLWLLSMIALPIARWIWGDGVIPAASTIGVILQCTAVLAVLRVAWGWGRLAIAFAIVAVLTWGAEWLGSTTGIPFGAYHYTGALQPHLSGVPLLIPLAWMMMLAPSWAAAQAILGLPHTPRQRLQFAALVGLAMVAWDLYLDPQMVGWGFWVWEQPGAYFGIPLVNFVGWFIVAALVTLVVRPARVPLVPLLLVYGIVWAFQAIGLAVFWGQVGPALFGFAAMGAVLGFAIRNGRRTLWTP